MARQVRRARAVGAIATVLALAACGAQGGGRDPEADRSTSPPTSPSSPARPSASESPTSSATAPVADPEHAVAPPGPFRGALVPADILVYAQRPLPDDVVRRVRRLRGVSDVEQLSLANVSLQNRVYTIGAVDPSTYRNFSSAGQQHEIWARVAGGELALPQDVARELRPEEDGFVRLGSDADAPEVHIGAYAPQAGGVDMVVNEKWGEELFQVRDNALLVYTGARAPLSLRKPIQRLVGRGTSIQMLDAVARFGLDPDAVQTAIPTGGTVTSAVGPFSYRLVNGRVVPDAAWVAANIRTEVVPILGRITCHKVMLPQLRAALAEVETSGLASEVYQTAGCYYPRFIANTTRLSNHAFGLAIDINSLQNQRGTVGQMHPQVVAIFRKWGFAWGGDWAWTDPMHFEVARLVRPD